MMIDQIEFNKLSDCDKWRYYRDDSERVAKLCVALDSIKEICARVMPNSGWMYLGIINDIHAIADDCRPT